MLRAKKKEGDSTEGEAASIARKRKPIEKGKGRFRREISTQRRR